MARQSLQQAKTAGSEVLTVGSTTTVLTATTYNNFSVGATSGREAPFALAGFKAGGGVLEVKSNAIYYTLDGTNPSATTSHRLATGDVLELSGYGKLTTFKAIRDTTDAGVYVTYYKE